MKKILSILYCLLLSTYIYGDVVLGSATNITWVSAGANNMVATWGTPVVLDWQLEIATPTNNSIFRITPTGATNLLISWGDGNSTNYSGSSTVLNQYVSSNTYVVKLSGSAQQIVIAANAQDRTYLKGIKSEVLGISNLNSLVSMFNENTKLTNLYPNMFNALTDITTVDSLLYVTTLSVPITIPTGLFTNNLKVNTFRRAFYGRKMTSIPEDVWGNNTNTLSFFETFRLCSALTNIPEGLFYSVTNANNFASTFQSCDTLTDIPPLLFSKNINATTFFQTFLPTATPNLTNIPSGLFTNNLKVTSYEGTFHGQTKIKNIPADLFGNNTNSVTFKSTFLGMTTLTNISAGLFDGCTKANSFNATFKDCQNLVTIPQNLFDNCKSNTTFAATFAYNYLLGGIPDNLFASNTEVTTFAQCFSTCQGTTFTQIPSGLFSSCTKVTTFSECFSGCKYILTIPSSLFNFNTNVTTFFECFLNPYALTAIPEGLFTNNLKVTDFSEVFSGNAGPGVFKNLPADLFGNNTNAMDMSYAFYLQTQITNIPPTTFASVTNVKNVAHIFNGCSNIKSALPVFWDTNIYPNTNLLTLANHTNAFLNCTNAANWADVPAGQGWGK